MGSRYGTTVGGHLTRAWLWPFRVALIGLLGTGCGVLPFGKGAEPRPVVPSRVAYTAEDGHVYIVPLGGGDARRASQIGGQVPGETVGREAPVPRWPKALPTRLLGANSRCIGPSLEMAT